MNAEFFEALTMLEKERGLTAEYLIEKIKAAIVIAVKKDYEVEDENVLVEIDTVTGKFNVSLVRDIVEEVENPHTQLTLEEAQAIRKTYKMGQRVVTPLKTKDFGRIAAQTAKHVIRQGIREAERNQLFNDMQGKAHEIVTARVTRVDPDRGLVALDMGKGEAILPRSEQVPGEEFFEGQHVQVYVKDVVVTERGPRVIISRTSEQLVKRMFEMEVPEIFDGTVEIRAISREAGVRTKMDDSDNSPGWKFAEYEMKGVPLRVEIGPKDMEKNQCCICRRDSGEKVFVSLDELEITVSQLLDAVHDGLYQRAKKNLEDHTKVCMTLDEVKEFMESEGGFAKTMWCGDLECELKMKEQAGVSSRCMPLQQEHVSDVCVCCGKPAKHSILWGVAY